MNFLIFYSVFLFSITLWISFVKGTMGWSGTVWSLEGIFHEMHEENVEFSWQTKILISITLNKYFLWLVDQVCIEYLKIRIAIEFLFFFRILLWHFEDIAKLPSWKVDCIKIEKSDHRLNDYMHNAVNDTILCPALLNRSINR